MIMRHSPIITGLAVHQTLPLVISGGTDRHVRGWDYDLEVPVFDSLEDARDDGEASVIHSISFGGMGKYFSFVTPNNTVKRVHFENGAFELASHNRSVDASEITHGHRHDILAIGTYDGHVGLLRGRDDSFACTYRLDSYPVVMAFSDYDDHLAVATAQSSVFIVDIRGDSVVTVLRQHSYGVRALQFVGKSRELIIGCEDQCLRLDLATNRALVCNSFVPAVLYSMVVVPSKSVCVMGNNDGLIRLYSLADFRELDTAVAIDSVSANVAFVYCLAYSEGRDTLISGGEGGEFRFWAIKDNKLVPGRPV